MKIKCFILCFFTTLLLNFCKGQETETLNKSAAAFAQKLFNPASIPDSFSNNKGTLLVVSDIKREKNRKKLEDIFETYYQGKYEIVSSLEKDGQVQPDSLKNPFVLFINSSVGLEQVKISSTSATKMRTSGGTYYNDKETYSYLYIQYQLKNTKTGEMYPIPFETNDRWMVKCTYLVERLNEKLHQKK